MANTRTIDIAAAAANYCRRTTNQEFKRAQANAERANGDRLCKLKGADRRLQNLLRDMARLDHAKTVEFARSIGVPLPN